MAIDLTKRAEKGSPITETEHDTNLTDIETAVNGLSGSATWDAGSIAVGGMEAKDVTVTGVVLGDFAIASFSVDLTDLILDAQVTAPNVVTCVLSNNTAGAVDLTSGIVYVRVIVK